KQKELAPLLEKINATQSLIDVNQSEYNILKEKVDPIKQKQADEDAVTFRESCRKSIIIFSKNISSLVLPILDKKKRLLNSSTGQVLSSLIKLKGSGRIKGSIVWVTFGVIDDKYDVAISIACPALNNIVVDSIELKIKAQLEDSGRNLVETKQKEIHWRNSLRKLGGDEEQEFQITLMMHYKEIDDLKEKISPEKIQNSNPNLSVLEDYRIREKGYLLRVRS
ncbi:2890_t:CDS:2, partial [Funneliformis caledonium]